MSAIGPKRRSNEEFLLPLIALGGRLVRRICVHKIEREQTNSLRCTCLLVTQSAPVIRVKMPANSERTSNNYGNKMA